MNEHSQSFEDRVRAILEKSIRPAEEIILDDLEIRSLLKISRRTAYKYRKLGYIPYHRFNNGKVFYILSEIIDSVRLAGKQSNHI